MQDERNVRIVIDYEDGRCNSFSGASVRGVMDMAFNEPVKSFGRSTS